MISPGWGCNWSRYEEHLDGNHICSRDQDFAPGKGVTCSVEPYLVKPFIPQETPWEKGTAGHSGQQSCRGRFHRFIPYFDHGPAVKKAYASQHVTQPCFCCQHHPCNDYIVRDEVPCSSLTPLFMCHITVLPPDPVSSCQKLSV